MAQWVNLPMYNMPEMRDANASFWNLLRTLLRKEGLEDIPESIEEDRLPIPGWFDPNLLFTQICGYPLRTQYAGQLHVVGIPSYDAPGCGHRTYRSFILVPRNSHARCIEDLRGRTFALNDPSSNSGMNLPRRMLAPLAGGKPFFETVVTSGSHAASMELVAAEDADAASVDCVTYAFYRTYRPDILKGLRVLTQTSASPAIPFVTACSTSSATMAALRRVLTRCTEDKTSMSILRKLRIRSITPASEEVYDVFRDDDVRARAVGYPIIA